MKIKALVNIFFPDQKGMVAGQEYDVTETIGMMLVQREQAEAIRKQKVESEHKESKKSTK